jgi:hypothetical protein
MSDMSFVSARYRREAVILPCFRTSATKSSARLLAEGEYDFPMRALLKSQGTSGTRTLAFRW